MDTFQILPTDTIEDAYERATHTFGREILNSRYFWLGVLTRILLNKYNEVDMDLLIKCYDDTIVFTWYDEYVRQYHTPERQRIENLNFKNFDKPKTW